MDLRLVERIYGIKERSLRGGSIHLSRHFCLQRRELVLEQRHVPCSIDVGLQRVALRCANLQRRR